MPEEVLPIVARVVRANVWDALDLAVVFGSAASGRLRPGSDVDVLIRQLPSSPPLANKLHQDLESTLAGELRREIDLVIDGPSTSVVLRREIAGKGIPIFERTPGAFHRFVVDAIRAYIDLEPQLRLFAEATRARAIREGEAALGRVVGGLGR